MNVVFFDDPAAVAKERTANREPSSSPVATPPRAPLASSADSEEARPTSGPDPSATSAQESADEAANPAQPSPPAPWSKRLPRDVLLAEVTEIRRRLDEHMQRVEAYNGHYREVRVDAALLAVLAGITALGDHDVPWKHLALHIRDVAAQVSKQATGIGPNNYRPAHESYVKLAPLFEGKLSRVKGLDPKPVLEMPWAGIADLAPLMQRLNAAVEVKIKEAVADESLFRRSRSLIVHEASLVATLARVISSSYDEAQEQTYRQFAADLEQQALALVETAEKATLADASQRLAQLTRSCKNCHDDYRFSDER